MGRPNTLAGAVLAIVLSACAIEAPSEEAPPDEVPRYQIHYQATLLPKSGAADVSITVSQRQSNLRELNFNAPATRFGDFDADGDLDVTGERVRWALPTTGGSIRYTARVNRLRGDLSDARLTEQWGIFRLDQLFPPATARALKATSGEATLSFDGPTGWRFETPYGPSNETVHTVDSNHLLPRPVGWAIAGKLGIRRDLIAERQIAVAAPVGEAFRRQDTLAFIRWTLPELIAVFSRFPARLLVVGSAQDMWRGGLSGPRSLYIHPGRPLISGNGTSTLLHELVHVAIGSTPGNSDDWLVEGLAEYYSLELLRRTGGISGARFDDGVRWLRDWAERDNGRLTDPSTGADTAHAAVVLHEIGTALLDQGHSLDELVRQLLERGEITGNTLLERLAAYGVDIQPLESELAGTGAR